MEIAKVQVSGVSVEVAETKPITRGMVGAQVRLEYTDPIWDDLIKTVVFRSGKITRDVVGADDTATIPHEVLLVSGWPLLIGVFGTNADGTLVVPTVWAKLGDVQRSANPSGDTSTNPQLPVWAQLLAQIGVLEQEIAELDGLFVATYGETTNEEIWEADRTGKLILCYTPDTNNT